MTKSLKTSVFDLGLSSDVEMISMRKASKRVGSQSRATNGSWSPSPGHKWSEFLLPLSTSEFKKRHLGKTPFHFRTKNRDRFDEYFSIESLRDTIIYTKYPKEYLSIYGPGHRRQDAFDHLKNPEAMIEYL